MPWVDEPVAPQPILPSGTVPPNPLKPSGIDVVAAAFRTENPIVSVARRLNDAFYPAEEGHNPLNHIAGTMFEERYLDRFLGSQSGAETFAIMGRIQQEEEDRKALDAAGFGGTLASIAAGTLDPTLALPGGVLVRGVKGGYSLARSAASVSAAAALSAGVSEAALQASQETRTLGESMANVGSAAILGGLIGGGAAAFLSKAERSVLEGAIDDVRLKTEAHANGMPAPAGAAAADTRALELESSGLGWTGFMSTTRRVLSAESVEARRVVADGFETPYRFKGDEGPRGPAMDRIVRMQINGTRVEVSDGLERLFSEYRFGDVEQRLPRMKATFEDLTGRAPDRMTYGEFKAQVSRALQEGDRHDVPQVQQAAELIRARVFEPWKERAIAAGLLPEGVDVKTAASYFQRVYNKEMIRARRPEFVTKVQDWLKSDQTTKAAAKERITALNDELQGFEAAIAKANNEEAAISLAARRDAVRAKIEEEIAAWDGKSVSEAKSAIKAREQYDSARQAKAADEGAGAPADRLRAADSAIDRAVKRIIESDRDLSDAELRERAHEITERILGSPDGRLPYDIPTGGPEIGWRGAGGVPARGALAAREFNIPDATIREYLEDDVETVVAMHLRTMVPDVLMTERFGDVRMTEAFKKIEEDYARLTDAATSEKERVRLGKEREAVIRDIAAMRDRVRGVYGWSPDMRNMARIAAAAKTVNNLTSMGVAAISSLPDFAGVIFRHGFTNALQDGWVPYFKYLTGNNPEWAQHMSQMRAIGIGIETATNARQNSLDDIADVYRPQSRFERGLQAANDKFFIANLLAPATDIQKMLAAHVSVSEHLRYVKAAAEGKATAKQLANLAEGGIDQQMAGRIWGQFSNKGGEVINGVHLPNTADWADRAAADALNAAVAREVDIMVVTPGQEKLLTMSKPVGSLLFQFKSFTAAATERVLVANLMRRDAHALSGLVAAVSLGMLSYKLNSFFGGQKTSDRPQDWFKEGISRGGLLGWFEEGNALASKMTRGGVDVYRMIGADKPLSRFASRSTLDMFLGPTAAKVEGISKVTGAAASGDWSAADTTALRRLMATQNLFYTRGLLNQLEGGFNQMLDVPPRPEPEQRR